MHISNIHPWSSVRFCSCIFTDVLSPVVLMYHNIILVNYAWISPSPGFGTLTAAECPLVLCVRISPGCTTRYGNPGL